MKHNSSIPIIMTPDPELNLAVVQGKFVCAKCCLNDEHIKRFVEDNSVPNGVCSYCHAQSAMPMPFLLENIKERLSKEWLDPWVYDASGKAPDLEGYFSGDQLPEEVGFDAQTEEFCTDFRETFADTRWSKSSIWFPPKPLFPHLEEWHGFCHTVKHKRRYFFASDSNDIGAMLFRIGSVAQQLGFFQAINAGETLYRGRVGKHNREVEMIAPPPEKARFPNRMSPAGVSMFYGAFDKETAIRETYDKEKGARGDTVITIAKFRMIGAVMALNLTEFPDMPSPFAPNSADPRLAISFMQWFSEEAAQPVQKDGREHIEYVPTQVFTEFLSEFGGRERGFPPVNGVVYPSIQHSGGKACAFYPCFDDDKERKRDKNLALESLAWYRKTAQGKWVKTKDSPE